MRMNILDMMPRSPQSVNDALWDAAMRGDQRPQVRTCEQLDTTPKTLPPTPQDECCKPVRSED